MTTSANLSYPIKNFTSVLSHGLILVGRRATIISTDDPEMLRRWSLPEQEPNYRYIGLNLWSLRFLMSTSKKALIQVWLTAWSERKARCTREERNREGLILSIELCPPFRRCQQCIRFGERCTSNSKTWTFLLEDPYREIKRKDAWIEKAKVKVYPLMKSFNMN